MSDRRLQENITTTLAFEPSLQSDNIRVSVKSGTVQLAGSVATLAEKEAAHIVTKRVFGVNELVSELRVELRTTHERQDLDIEVAAMQMLAWNASIPPNAVKLSVVDGWMTIEGCVQWQYQKHIVENTVRYLYGIRGITNLIRLQSRTPTTTNDERTPNTVYALHESLSVNTP